MWQNTYFIMAIGIPTGLAIEEAAPLSSAVEILKKIGFFDVIVPFLLIFSVTFGALQKTKIFGDKGAGVNSVVAFSIAMIVTAATKVVGMITGFMEQLGVWIVFIVFFLMTATMVFGQDVSKIMEGKGLDAKLLKVVGVSLALIGIILAMLFGTGWINNVGTLSEAAVSAGFTITPEDISLIVMLVIFAIIIAIVVKGSSSSAPKG